MNRGDIISNAVSRVSNSYSGSISTLASSTNMAVIALPVRGMASVSGVMVMRGMDFVMDRVFEAAKEPIKNWTATWATAEFSPLMFTFVSLNAIPGTTFKAGVFPGGARFGWTPAFKFIGGLGLNLIGSGDSTFSAKVRAAYVYELAFAVGTTDFKNAWHGIPRY